MHLEYRLTVSENGRVLLPAKFRDQYQIKPGDQLLLSCDDDVKLILLSEKIKDFQKIIKKSNKNNISLVDELKKSRSKDE
ncbi:MAG: AbrB/MazE/SpoVT family DNA-binding domain-containing protein [Gammaproteobacteria bacterium]